MPVRLPTRYRLIRAIGSGRSATVWLGRDRWTGTDVAVKVIRGPDNADSPQLPGLILERFERETRSLGRLRGTRGICQILQVGVDVRLTRWLVTEHLVGGSLSDADKVLTVDDCRLLFEALASAHSLGVAHGDISPNNILFGSTGSPVLSDFGMSDIADTNTRSAVSGLTPAFAAPERIRGARPAPSSDVYALATTLSDHVTEGNRVVRRVLAEATVADPTKRPTAAKIARRLR